MDAILDKIPAELVRDRMVALDQRRQAIEAQLSQEPAASPLRIHPSMAATYRKRIGALIRGLGDAEHMPEAKEAVRALIDRIVLTPTPARGALVIDLEGTLAALLCLATGRPLKGVSAAANTKKAPGGARGALAMSDELVLVAGAGFGLWRTFSEFAKRNPETLAE
ncbi:hypothetical protein V8J36_22200 [Frigidibacter sp. MR17.14]|uniref:hypothetical protein n=1 Tax=Frigidibacter sp. MR17.14 TaxID=3126509 RepID=UPI003012F955